MNIKIDEQVAYAVERYAKALGLEPEELVNRFLFMYLDTNKEILKCPQCNEPVVWTSMIPLNEGEDEMECPSCGRKCIVNWEEDSIR